MSLFNESWSLSFKVKRDNLNFRFTLLANLNCLKCYWNVIKFHCWRKLKYSAYYLDSRYILTIILKKHYHVGHFGTNPAKTPLMWNVSCMSVNLSMSMVSSLSHLYLTESIPKWLSVYNRLVVSVAVVQTSASGRDGDVVETGAADSLWCR